MPNHTHQSIIDFTVNTGFNDFYILSSVFQRTTQAGKPYLGGILSDAGGRIPFVMWDNIPTLTDSDAGKIVYVCGEVQDYRNAPQVKVNTLRLAADADSDYYRLADLVPYAPIDTEKASEEIYDALAALKDDLYAPLTFETYADLYLLLSKIPAAKSIHHSFVGGWVMHTRNMMHMAEQVYQQYKDVVPIDHDLLITGIFLHDIGKFREYMLSEHSLVKEYSVDGRLLGHPTLGVMMVEEMVHKYFKDADPQKIKLLEHIIASHHGSPDCGAAVYPQTVEAEIVHQLDSMDSRVEIFRGELEKTTIGQFSGFNRSLERSVYHHGMTI